MKTIFFIITAIFSFSSFSLQATGSTNEEPTDKLYAMLGYPCYLKDGTYKLYPFIIPRIPWEDYPICPDGCFPLEKLAFTGNNIQSYNMATREFVCLDCDLPVYEGFSIYLNDMPLLENITIFNTGSLMGVDDIVLLYNYPEDKYYFRDGSREFSSIEPGEKDYDRMIRQKENKEKRKEGWDTFIQHLRNAGKIIGENTNVESINLTELNTIEIYPNPTTGELRIRQQRSALANYETTFSVSQLGIEEVEIYDIMGKKHPTVNYQLSTVNSIDISQLPAGIYFVRITTEKGVVTKKVVKK